MGAKTKRFIVAEYQTNPHMEEKLNNILHLIENNLATSQYLQSRTRDALDFVSLLSAVESIH